MIDFVVTSEGLARAQKSFDYISSLDDGLADKISENVCALAQLDYDLNHASNDGERRELARQALEVYLPRYRAEVPKEFEEKFGIFDGLDREIERQCRKILDEGKE